MRIAVFGATGRTGVPLVRQALDRGHEVVAFVRLPGTLSFEPDEPGLTVFEGDASSGDPAPVPAGRGECRTLFDPADIGRLAARAVTAPARFGGATIELATGAYTLDEIAAVMSEVVGSEVRPEPVAVDAFVEPMGAPPAFARFMQWQNERHSHDADRLRAAFDFEPTPLAEAFERLWRRWDR